MTAPAGAPRTLLLWDVDHTLIETRGVGRAIYERAFLAATGRPLERLAAISGRTELDIMAESLRINGLETSEQMMQRLAGALIQGYEDARDELATTGRALPAARDTLERFVADSTVHQAILTGNLRPVARIKLEVFGLAGYLHFDSSAFGDDHSERARLVDIARRRAEDRTGTTFAGENVLVIGDTPNDVQAALTAGVRVIGVATGKATAPELRLAGATHVVDSLTTFSL
ncbi:haloacid dehalogenase-like hydrolase [Amycolatopsis sp. cmx-11-51]|uniref:haloacid dehalogenase-like hydrolase n=1 Tax=Amycolatopsis sp. cmx-11-51 TaxID=2785797 RepID=UPI0039E5B37C